MANVTFYPTREISYDVLVDVYHKTVAFYRSIGAKVVVSATGTSIDTPIMRVTFHKYPRASVVTMSTTGKHTQSSRIHQFKVME